MMMKLVSVLSLLVVSSASLLRGSSSNTHPREVQAMVGGYHPASAKDPSVREAAEFAMHALSESTVAYTGFDPAALSKPKISLAKAETQVVAGMNFRLTLIIKQDKKCVGSFDVEIYDHFGEMTITSWGEEHTCAEAHGIRKRFNKSLLKQNNVDAPPLLEEATLIENLEVEEPSDGQPEDQPDDEDDAE